MSDDGVGAEAYSHKARRNLYFYCCMCRILVVTNEMVDVEIGSILFEFTDMYVKCDCLEEALNVFDRLQTEIYRHGIHSSLP